MKQRLLANTPVAEIGLGCMNLSHAYAKPPPREDGIALLHRALDLGVTHFDTAAIYGFGRNEELLGEALASRRSEIHLASKCGMTGVDGKRVIDGRPETIRRTCDESLSRLRTDHVDIYYLHRWDKSVPVEESIGGMSRLVEEGKVRALGLSEVSADTLRKAHREHPISAVQTEYSLWTRNPEIAVLEACRELGATLVAFSPVARGFLAGGMRDLSTLTKFDLRNQMPRFQEPHFSQNLKLVDELEEIARDTELALAQLALGWLLAQGDHIVPIPGTTSIAHLEENVAASEACLSPELVARLGELVNQETVSGKRYPDQNQSEVDTEQFESVEGGVS
jgi:aryl-alcohol dehydrogenase-like predicted oxidoreductase